MFGSSNLVILKKRNTKQSLGVRWASKIPNKEVHIDYDQMPYRSTFLLLGVLGAVPFTWKQPYLPSLHVTRSTVGLSAITSIAIYFFAYLEIQYLSTRLLTEEMPVKEWIICIERTTAWSYYFVLPVTWSDVATLRNLVEIWLRLMHLFYRLAGHHLTLRRLSHEIFFNAALTIGPLVAYVIGKKFTPELKNSIYFALSLIPCVTIDFLLCLLWCASYGALDSLAKEVNTIIKKELNRGSLTSSKMRDYRNLWLEMRSLSDRMSSLNCAVFAFILTTLSTICIVYTAVTLLRAGNLASAIWHFIVSAFVLQLNFLMARAGHTACEQIKHFYDNVLAGEALSSIQDSTQWQVINMYLTDNMRTPVATLGGFAILNKTIVSSVFGGIATYLVMFFQLSQNAQSQYPSKKFENETF